MRSESTAGRTALCAAISLAAAIVLAPVRTAVAQDYGAGPYTFYLHQPSNYQQGCWGPCDCALSNEEVMRGTFTLSLVNIGNVTDFYSISNVQWKVPTLGGQPFNAAMNGSGVFLAGQVPFATHQHMELDLTLMPPPSPWSGVQRFDTTPASAIRTLAPPVISMQLANSTTGCPGIRVNVVATRYRSDFDATGTITVGDIFAFLNAWFAGSAHADFNGAGGLEVQDIFDFLGAWFAGV